MSRVPLCLTKAYLGCPAISACCRFIPTRHLSQSTAYSAPASSSSTAEHPTTNTSPGTTTASSSTTTNTTTTTSTPTSFFQPQPQHPPNPEPPRQPKPPPKTKSHNLPPRPTLPEPHLHEKFLHGSGPGGQKINKTASCVQLTHTPTGLQIKCQATRSRTQNRKIARRLLAERVEVLEKGGEARVKVREGVRVERKRSGEKKRGRKYRRLEVDEGEDGEDEGEGQEVGGQSEVERMFEEAKRRMGKG